MLLTTNNIYNITIIHALHILQQGPPLPKRNLTDKQVRANRKSIVYFESGEVELVYRLTTAAYMSTTKHTTTNNNSTTTTNSNSNTNRLNSEVEGLTMADLNLNLQ